MTQRVVIVGAGLAGLRTAESLRRADFRGEIMVVGAEEHPPYTRPPLSKDALRVSTSIADLVFRQRAATNDVTWLPGRPVVSADLSGRSVTLVDTTKLEYDGLIVASGLRPRRIAPARAGSHVLRTVEDAARLRTQLVRGARVVIIGAGFIGCEVAVSARTLGCDVTVVAVDEVPMFRPLGALVGWELRRRIEAHGVRFLLGVGVDQVVAGKVSLSAGEVLLADVIVEAVGSHPNTEWLAGNRLDLSDGVLADNGLRVLDAAGMPLRGVHVVGDLARYPNPAFDGTPRRIEHWSNGTDTGRRAGAVLAAQLRGSGDEAASFAPIPSFWSDLGELQLQSYGMPGLADTVEVLEGDLAGPVVVGYRRAADLVAVVGLDMTSRLAHHLPNVGRHRC